MKKQILLFSILIGFISCTTSRRGNSSTAAASTHHQTPANQASPTFIETIAIKPSGTQNSTKATNTSYPALSNESTESGESSHGGLSASAALIFKFAILLDVPVEELTDMKLIEFMESWYGTRYRYGGNDRTGVDCSAFSKDFVLSLYSFAIPRTSSEQYKQSKRIRRDDLQEGDLVFFYTRGRRNGISHVGVYLRNNRFIHAATSGGVTISSLDETYYSQNYAGAGRIK